MLHGLVRNSLSKKFFHKRRQFKSDHFHKKWQDGVQNMLPDYHWYQYWLHDKVLLCIPLVLFSEFLTLLRQRFAPRMWWPDQNDRNTYEYRKIFIWHESWARFLEIKTTVLLLIKWTSEQKLNTRGSQFLEGYQFYEKKQEQSFLDCS